MELLSIILILIVAMLSAVVIWFNFPGSFIMAGFTFFMGLDLRLQHHLPQ
jgi:hypothetical protein